MMNNFLFISELQHFFVSLAIALFFFWRYRDWRIIPFCLLVGFFIDLDHWFDQFACFGFDLSLTKFFNFDYVYECQKVIVLLHGWEFLIPLWLIGKLINKKFKIKGLEWAISLAYLGHLFLDQFSCSRPLFAYSFIYRLLNNFSLGSFNTTVSRVETSTRSSAEGGVAKQAYRSLSAKPNLSPEISGETPETSGEASLVSKDLPSISILIPTLNAARVLKKCLKSIAQQDYPKEKIEIIIADGGSTDKTLEIARKYGAKIYKNPLKTGEAGKAVALKKAKNELVALIDSDNILPSKNWFKKMIEPFADSEIMGSEPWEFTYRKNDSLVNRYCALIGVNDTYCYFIGNYDKKSFLSGKWTGLRIEEEDKGEYLKIKLKKGILPTIGANGTIWRTKILKKAVGKSDYLFDTDVPYLLVAKKPLWFAKVKTGIIHDYCQEIGDFFRKQKRRAKDFFYLESKEKRGETYQREINKQLYFIIATITVIPLIIQTIKGYLKKPDSAWFFHPLACLITLWLYGSETILAKLGKVRMERKEWRQ